jgi:hypothetical protein
VVNRGEADRLVESARSFEQLDAAARVQAVLDATPAGEARDALMLHLLFELSGEQHRLHAVIEQIRRERKLSYTLGHAIVLAVAAAIGVFANPPSGIKWP